MSGFDRIGPPGRRGRGDSLRRTGHDSRRPAQVSPDTGPAAQRGDPFSRMKPPRTAGRPDIFEREGLDVIPESDILDPVIGASGGIDTREIYANLTIGQAQRRTNEEIQVLKWVEMDSSRVARGAFNPDNGELLVDFVDGTPWSYFHIEADTAQKFFTSESPGRFINQYFTPVDAPALVPHGYRA